MHFMGCQLVAMEQLKRTQVESWMTEVENQMLAAIREACNVLALTEASQNRGEEWEDPNEI